jgi:hypothetical protein
MLVMSTTASSRGLYRTTETLRPRSTARILLSTVHLLLELLCLLLIHEAQPCKTVLQFKGVEERPILIIVPRIVDLLVPDDAPVGLRDVYHLEKVRMAHQILGQHYRTLQPRVRPSCRLIRRVGYV